jgi:pyruvate-formate lyase
MKKKNDFSMEINFTKIYRENMNEHKSIREGKCLNAQYPAVLEDIQDNDRIAGRSNWRLVGFSPHNAPTDCGYGYYCHQYRIIDAIENGDIPIDQRDDLLDLLQFWKSECSESKVEAAFPEYMIKALFRQELNPLPFNYKPTVANPLYRMAGVFVDYQKLLKLGIRGLKKEVIEFCNKAKAEGGDFKLYEGMLLALEALVNSCIFYREQAVAKADKTTDKKRKKELKELANVLNRIASNKPETFYEALQLSWLYTLLCGSLELGRMDVYLGDFYVNDIDKGVITNDEAVSLMHSIWKLVNDLMRVVDGRIIIGGKGRPNEVNADKCALMILEAAKTYGRSVLPQLTLRFYEGMNPSLVERSMELIANGHTFPLMYNDDVLIPSVMNAHDVPEKDAEQYMPLGCGEIVLDHMAYGTPSGSLNVLKALEITMYDGVDPITGKRLGLPTGKFEDFGTFEEFFKAYKKQLKYFIEILAEHESLEYKITGETSSYLFLSLLYDNCMERGKGIFSGGVKYLGGTLESFGSVNAADSLTAIKKLVFDDKKISKNKLLDILKNNFAGYEKEKQMLKNQPKYGNDYADADDIMIELHNFLALTMKEQKNNTGLNFYLNVIINNSQNTTLGRWVGATADGRKAGREMANANTPAGGNDTQGITALINSIVKLDTSIHAGAVHNIRFGADFVNEHSDMFNAVVKTYFQKGGSQAMITVINRGDLEKALSEPEKYKDLVVRVGGFSAKFVELSKDVQLEILSRTTY